jgi:hypothetical protein
MPNS